MADPAAPLTPPDTTAPIAPQIAGVGGLDLAGSAVKVDPAAPSLYDQTRPAQWSGPAMPEAHLWGALNPKVADMLSVPADPPAGWIHLTKAVAGYNATAVTEGVLKAVGDRLVQSMPSHRPDGHALPGQAPLAAAAFELARWDHALNAGLITGPDAGKAESTWRRLMRGQAPSQDNLQHLVDTVADFADKVQWAEHPELAVHPLVGVSKVKTGAESAAHVNVLDFDQVEPAAASHEMLADRLAQSVALHPGALTDFMRANIVDAYKASTPKTGGADPAKVVHAALGWAADPSTVGGAPVEHAYQMAAADLNAPVDAIKATASSAPDLSNGRIRDLLAQGTPKPVDWQSFAGPLPATAKASDLNGKPDDSHDTVVQSAATPSVLAGGMVPPEQMRGLVPSPLTTDGKSVMVPVKPAPVVKVPSGLKLPYDGETTLPWKRPGFWMVVLPPSRLADQSGQVRSGDESNRRVLAELHHVGVPPVQSQPLNEGVMADQSVHPMALEFRSADDLRRAHAAVTAAVLPANAAATERAPVVAYVNGPSEAPSGTSPVWEAHHRDVGGSYGVNWSDQPVAGGNGVTAYAEPGILPAGGVPGFAQTNGRTVFAGQLAVQPGDKVEAPSGPGSLWDVRVAGRKANAATLTLDPPSIVYGQPKDDTQIRLERHGEGVKVMLPGPDEAVSPQTAHDVASLLRRVGVTGTLTFSGQQV